VDATIVSVEDVYAALDYLHYEANPSWSDENREIAKMEILLGFFPDYALWKDWGRDEKIFRAAHCCQCWYFQRMNAD